MLFRTAAHELYRFIAPMKSSLPAFQAVKPPPRASRKRPARASIPDTCDNQITPECLQAMYNIPTAPVSASGNSLTVVGFLNDIPNRDDLGVGSVSW